MVTKIDASMFDAQGKEIILDADADTSITADTDDQIDIKIAGADDFQFTANKFLVQTGSNIDMNGTELILDADADTSITADTDDQIDIKIAGADDFRFTANNFNILSGSTLTVDSGATITNSGTATGFGANTAVDSITAGSTQTQAGATALTGRINRVTVSGTNGDGVKLPTAVAGTICEIINGDAAQTIDVWPASGDKIQGGSTDAVDPTSIAAGTSREFYCIDAAEWLRNIPVGTILQRQIFTGTGLTNNTTTTESATAVTDIISLLDAGSAVRITAMGSVGAHRNVNTPTNLEGIVRLWRTAITSGTLVTAIQYGKRDANAATSDSLEVLNTFVAEDSPSTKSATTYVVGLQSIHTDVLAQWNGRNRAVFMILEEIAT